VRRELADDILRLWQDPKAEVPEPRKAGLRSLGLIAGDDRVIAPVLSKGDDERLSEIAAAFRPALLQILEAARPSIHAVYGASPYFAEGVAFEEYAIWWYHAFYTAVTDRLIARGSVTTPKRATLTYFTVA